MMLSKIRQTKLGKFIFAVGCLFPVGIVFLIMFIFTKSGLRIGLRLLLKWKKIRSRRIFILKAP